MAAQSSTSWIAGTAALRSFININKKGSGGCAKDAEGRQRHLANYCVGSPTMSLMSRAWRFSTTKGARKYPVLASHSQVSWSENVETDPADADIIRPPKVLRRTTARSLCGGLSKFKDCGSMFPSSLPSAKWHVSLVSCDNASANRKLLRHTLPQLPDSSLMLTSTCCQHRTGNIVKQLTDDLGILGECFGTAATLQRGDLHADVRDMAHALLRGESGLQVVHEWNGAWHRERELHKQLLDLCFVHPIERNSEALKPSDKAAEVAQEFAQFFPAPWSEGLVHYCPPGCCDSWDG